jgi:hypothetical protein
MKENERDREGQENLKGQQEKSGRTGQPRAKGSTQKSTKTTSKGNNQPRIQAGELS